MRPSLYIHIPFCIRKCEYCDFYSGVATEQDIDAYLDALEREFELRFSDRIAPATVFIGGGTPTRLSAKQLARLGELLHARVDLSDCREFTCEINPGTLTPDKADALVAMGVDRASFGVQSFKTKYLGGLGRAYEAGTATAAVEMARSAGIRRISMDLIFALPGQTLQELREDIDQALSHGTEHLSFYALTYEDDTPLTRQLLNGELQPCPEELEREMFTLVGDTCAAADLQRYEVSNFARPGAECRHNLVYWTLGDWHGLGSGAHGMIGGEITAVAADYKVYTRMIGEGTLPFSRREKLADISRAETLLLMGLRLTRGVELARFEQWAGASFATLCGEKASALERQGLIEISPTHVRATPDGLMVLDSLILELASSLETTV
ncbi:MAG: radical SAM family heme chaperone HemW [Planctomycetes bacterium]|nr:radical SAM family heme chaperone HemW [Planctomycetota bacterium]